MLADMAPAILAVIILGTLGAWAGPQGLLRRRSEAPYGPYLNIQSFKDSDSFFDDGFITHIPSVRKREQPPKFSKISPPRRKQFGFQSKLINRGNAILNRGNKIFDTLKKRLPFRFKQNHNVEKKNFHNVKVPVKSNNAFHYPFHSIPPPRPSLPEDYEDYEDYEENEDDQESPTEPPPYPTRPAQPSPTPPPRPAPRLTLAPFIVSGWFATHPTSQPFVEPHTTVPSQPFSVFAAEPVHENKPPSQKLNAFAPVANSHQPHVSTHPGKEEHYAARPTAPPAAVTAFVHQASARQPNFQYQPSTRKPAFVKLASTRLPNFVHQASSRQPAFVHQASSSRPAFVQYFSDHVDKSFEKEIPGLTYPDAANSINMTPFIHKSAPRPATPTFSVHRPLHQQTRASPPPGPAVIQSSRLPPIQPKENRPNKDRYFTSPSFVPHTPPVVRGGLPPNSLAPSHRHTASSDITRPVSKNPASEDLLVAQAGEATSEPRQTSKHSNAEKKQQRKTKYSDRKNNFEQTPVQRIKPEKIMIKKTFQNEFQHFSDINAKNDIKVDRTTTEKSLKRKRYKKKKTQVSGGDFPQSVALERLLTIAGPDWSTRGEEKIDR